jgi:hypothetical protein
MRKISPPTGFEHRTAQPADSRYTVCAKLKTNEINISKVILINLLAPEFYFLILSHPVYKM